jgi:hypothetical protein
LFSSCCLVGEDVDAANLSLTLRLTLTLTLTLTQRCRAFASGWQQSVDGSTHHRTVHCHRRAQRSNIARGRKRAWCPLVNGVGTNCTAPVALEIHDGAGLKPSYACDAISAGAELIVDVFRLEARPCVQPYTTCLSVVHSLTSVAMHTTAHHCTPLHTIAHHCTPLHTTAHHCTPLHLLSRYTVVCEPGDILMINTHLWWHSTEIPPTNPAADGLSFSYARARCAFFDMDLLHASMQLRLRAFTYLDRVAPLTMNSVATLMASHTLMTSHTLKDIYLDGVEKSAAVVRYSSFLQQPSTGHTPSHHMFHGCCVYQQKMCHIKGDTVPVDITTVELT